MFSLFSLFDILAILYLFRSVQLGLQIWREWPGIRSEPFTAHKKHLADQASYFIAVPIGVFFHELSHALAVWATGGQVVEFHYRAFWGYVVPEGNFTPAETWFIAIAGTLGSLIFGVAILLILRRAPTLTLRYFGLRAFRFQVYFSLIYYPLFTLLGFAGDWRTIYDFWATPLLSGITAVLHAGTLLLFWRGDRLGWFEAPSHETIPDQEQFDQLAAEAAFSPQDAQVQIKYIDALRRGGANNKARHHLNQFLAHNQDSAVGHLELAALSSASKRQIPKKAAQNAEKALQLGLENPQQAVYAYEIVGRYQLDSGEVEPAISSFTQAISLLDSDRRFHQLTTLYQLYILRGQAYRRQQQYELAYHDFQVANTFAQDAGNQSAISQVEQELETLEKHAGRPFGANSVKMP